MKTFPDIHISDDCIRVEINSDRLESKCVVLTLTHEGMIADCCGSTISTYSVMWDELEQSAG